MISGQDGLHRLRTRTLGVWVVAFWLACVWPARAHAQWRLLIAQPDDAELVTRVEGQTRDLEVKVEVYAGAWREAHEAAQLATARRADFVASVERGRDGALQVRVYGARSRSLRTRSVPRARGEKLGGSAELETAALVLRGELSALMHSAGEVAAGTGAAGGGGAAGAGGAAGGGGSSGPAGGVAAVAAPETGAEKQQKPDEAAREDEHEHEDEDEDEQVDEDEPEPPSPPLANYTAHRSAWTLVVGARGSLPIDHEIAFGGQIGGRIPLDWMELGLSFSSALPFELTDQKMRIRLQRHALGAEAHGVVPWGPRVRALLGVHAGVVLYVRETEAVSVDYEPEGDTPAWTGTFGAHAALQWLIARQWGLELGVGLDMILPRTAFAYKNIQGMTEPEIAVLRAVEPSATLGVFGLFGD